jgi:hypothetical protein
MQSTTNLIVVAPADLQHMFHDDPLVMKYRRKLAQLVITRTLACKSDRELLQPQFDRVYLQLRGRQITLLKASNKA